MQGILYPQGIINQLLQLLIILWSLSIAIKYIFFHKHKSKLLSVTSYLVFMYAIYGSILIVFGNPFLENLIEAPVKYIYLQVSLTSLLPIYVFYHYTYKGYITIHRIQFYALILIISLIPIFYYQQSLIMLQSSRDEVTNNMGYVFLSLIPLLCFFSNKPIIQYILLSITLLFIFIAMKRGAIIIASICMILIIYNNIISSNIKKRSIAIILSIIIIWGGIYFISHLMETSDYFALRIEQTLSGNSSGRNDIYEALLQEILNENNLLYFFLGRGADSTWAIAGNYAHQDWLETMCNNGIIGIFILFYFYYIFFKSICISKKIFNKTIHLSFILLFITSFSKTLFSMSIQNMEISQSLLVGYFTYWTAKYNKNT